MDQLRAQQEASREQARREREELAQRLAEAEYALTEHGGFRTRDEDECLSRRIEDEEEEAAEEELQARADKLRDAVEKSAINTVIRDGEQRYKERAATCAPDDEPLIAPPPQFVPPSAFFPVSKDVIREGTSR